MKYVYFFGAGKADGTGDMRDVLGGKGAGLAEMTRIGLPVPAGFTITTETCDYYLKHSHKYPKELRAEVDEIAPAFRAHIDREIARRKATSDETDDVLGRCLERQAAGEAGYSDVAIRTALLCMVVGGPPQPPMVVPQAMEQLLRRPDVLANAHRAAADGNDAELHDIVLEAMRFDPLAPGTPRIALADWTVARGTKRATTIPKGATVLAAFASAMMDERRVPEPRRCKSGGSSRTRFVFSTTGQRTG